jgi:hypothetical protein
VVDRIEKTDRAELWKISSTKETKEEKKRDEKGRSGQEQKDSFGETSDFIQLLSKDPRKYKSDKIAAAQIQGFTFRGISTIREKAILEVDISLANGTLLKGAQIALNRVDGMQYISRRPGEELVVDQIVKGTFLTVALPQKELTPSSEKISHVAPESEKNKISFTRFSWSYYLGFGAMFVAILLLIYIFLIL